MRRYSQRSGHTAMAELNVTPLLDLAFVLLIIFIITTPLLESNVAVELPVGPAHDSGPADTKSIRTVTVDKNGQIFLDKEPVELPVLEQQLTAFREQNPEAAVVVRADRTLPYQHVIDVVDTLQRAKISRMRLENVTP